jgi:UrcA family protein
MSLMNRKRAASMGLALLCTGAALATGAVPETTTQSISLNYVSAELNTPQGAEALYTRIKRAAQIVCHQVNIRELHEYMLYKQCYDRAVDAAVAKVDSGRLTALHRSKTQHPTTG